MFNFNFVISFRRWLGSIRWIDPSEYNTVVSSWCSSSAGMSPEGGIALVGAPGRAGSNGAEPFHLTMATKTNKKRLLEVDDSGPDSERTENWARFIVLSTLDTENEKPITKLSPFVIDKTLKGIIGEAQSIKKMKNENLMVECKNRSQSLVLQTTFKFGGIKVIGTPSFRLNRSKGVIRDKGRGLCDLEETEITNELKSQGLNSFVSPLWQVDFFKVLIFFFLLPLKSYQPFTIFTRPVI